MKPFPLIFCLLLTWLAGLPGQALAASQALESLRGMEAVPATEPPPALRDFINDKEGKPAGIYRHIGRRPIFAAGCSKSSPAGSGRRPSPSEAIRARATETGRSGVTVIGYADISSPTVVSASRPATRSRSVTLMTPTSWSAGCLSSSARSRLTSRPN